MVQQHLLWQPTESCISYLIHFLLVCIVVNARTARSCAAQGIPILRGTRMLEKVLSVRFSDQSPIGTHQASNFLPERANGRTGRWHLLGT